MFHIPGTNQETSFQECIELNIINAFSATVISEEKKHSLKRATEIGILDSTGHFSDDDRLITMKEAIQEGHILHESFREMEVEHQTVTVSSTSQSHEKIEQISENIRYDKNSGTYEVNSNMQPGE